MRMVIKRGRVETYLEWLLPIKSVTSITWSCNMWQTKIMYPLPQWGYTKGGDIQKNFLP